MLKSEREMTVDYLLKISWLITGLALCGTILNIYKNRCCFFVWLVTNSFFCLLDLHARLYSQAFLFLVYIGLAVWGLVKWKAE
jgi:nicotinamide riboside transporter PnuC